jgi:hypothetical protein
MNADIAQIMQAYAARDVCFIVLCATVSPPVDLLLRFLRAPAATERTRPGTPATPAAAPQAPHPERS